jgi:hypothetical protein
MSNTLFSMPIENRAFADFVYFQEKSQFDRCMLTLEGLLADSAIVLGRDLFQELFALAAGFDSVEQLLVNLPVAFVGMDTLVNLCLLVNERTPHFIYLEPISYYRSIAKKSDIEKLVALKDEQSCTYLYVKDLDEDCWSQLGGIIHPTFIEKSIIQSYLGAIFPDRGGFELTELAEPLNSLMENFAIRQFQEEGIGDDKSICLSARENTLINKSLQAYCHHLGIEQKKSGILKKNLDELSQALRMGYGSDIDWAAPFQAAFRDMTWTSEILPDVKPYPYETVTFVLNTGGNFTLTSPTISDIYQRIIAMSTVGGDHNLIESLTPDLGTATADSITVAIFVGS